MRCALAFLFASAIALPLPASWWPSWNPTSVRLAVGETTTVQVRAHWSGLVDYGGGIDWTFRSDRKDVATAFVRVTSTQQDVKIVAVGPGRASIRREIGPGRFDTESVAIEVVCGPEPPLLASSSALRGRVGEPMTIEVISDIAYRTAFSWYLGRDGDRSRPLAGEGPKITFTPAAPGTAYIWVAGTTPCSMSTVEFRIEVVRPRQRAVR